MWESPAHCRGCIAMFGTMMMMMMMMMMMI
jgi:hypothetical protein